MEKIELQNSRDFKIAIIGAGISGLTAAHTLKKLGYNDITLFEARDRVGGKVHTLEKDGYLYELGAILLFKQSKIIRNLAKEYNQPLTKRSKNSLMYSKGKLISAAQCIRDKFGIMDMIMSNFRLYRIVSRCKCFDTPGFTGVDPDLYVNFEEYAKKNKLDPLAYIFGPTALAYGYGYIDQVPSMYYLKTIKQAQEFAFKGELNNLFGLRLATAQTFDHGFQGLLNKMAENFEVRLGSKVKQVIREQEGNSVKISITAKGGTEVFDQVIISSIPVQTMKFLDMNKQEQAMFSKVKYFQFHETLFYGEAISGDIGAVIDNSHRTNPKGFPVSLINMNPEHNIFTAYQLHNGEFTDEKLEQKLVETISNMGGKVKEIILTETFEYFPHYDEKELIEQKPFERLENMQGENGTYFIGGLLNFETTEDTAGYAQGLINKHFPATIS